MNWSDVATYKHKCSQKIGAECEENQFWGLEGEHTHHPWHGVQAIKIAN